MGSPCSFQVNRCEAVVVPPAKPTPHELKQLSDIDDQDLSNLYDPKYALNIIAYNKMRKIVDRNLPPVIDEVL